MRVSACKSTAYAFAVVGVWKMALDLVKANIANAKIVDSTTIEQPLFVFLRKSSRFFTTAHRTNIFQLKNA